MLACDDPRVKELLEEFSRVEAVLEDSAAANEFSHAADAESLRILQDRLSEEATRVAGGCLTDVPSGYELKAAELENLVLGTIASEGPCHKEVGSVATRVSDSEAAGEHASRKNDTRSSSRPLTAAAAASAVVQCRNALLLYCDEARTVLTLSGDGLPCNSALGLVEDTEAWLRGEGAEATAVEVKEMHEQLCDRLAEFGVALRIEVRAFEARQAYVSELARFIAWLNKTRFASGSSQPLNSAQRQILEEYSHSEERWSENQQSLLASRQDFVKKTDCLRILRCGGDTIAQKRILRVFIEEKACELRCCPAKQLSVEQRRQAARAADSVLAWFDSHFTTDTTYETLKEQLDFVQYASARAFNMADITSARNDVEAYLDEVLSCATSRPHVIASLGAESCAELHRMAIAAGEWLKIHHSASLGALQALKREVRLRCAQLGLSTVEVKLPKVAPESTLPTSPPPSAPQSRGDRKEMASMDAACAIVEELMLLRIAITRAKAPHTDPNNAMLKELAGQCSTLIARVEKDCFALPRVPAGYVKELTSAFHGVAFAAEQQGVCVPPSCWNVLQVE